jgi:hypothetical protein
VGSDGLIKTATTNLVTYSQDFDQWSATNATVTPNAELAPDGTTTADQVTSTASDPWVQRSVTTASAGAYTFSVYIKAATGVSSNVVALRVFDSDGTIYGSTSISVTTEWQRYQISVTTAKPVTIVRVDAPNFATIGDVFYLWGAQLEQSSTVGEYIPTTSTINSAPRFDHDPTTGDSLGLLVEESRTNLLTYSEDFENAAWQTTNPGEVTLITGVADPAGGNNATTFYHDSGAGDTGFLRRIFSGTSGQPYVFSFWAKRRTGSGKLLATVGDNVAQEATNVTSAWKRFSFINTPTSSTVRVYIKVDSAGDEFDIWGAQLEAGSFPTSYIPTEGSTVTRAADVASISGSNFSSWYRQDEGTVFSNCRLTYENTVGGALHYEFSDGTTDEKVELFGRANGSTGAKVFDGGTELANFFPTFPIAANTAIKIALALKENDSAAKGFDDKSVQTDDSVTLPTVDRLFIGSGFTPSLNGTISRLTYWPQRLGNEVLQTITQ